MKKTVLVVFGTRPEAIKLAPVVIALEKDPRFEIVVCSSGQHRDMVRPVCDLFEVSIDHDLDVMKPGQTLEHITTAILDRLPDVFRQVRPDIVMVQGDTTTAFAAALSAFYHKIEVAHVEAGLRTNDLMSPWPEEGNRALIGRLATYHFAPTVGSLDNLLREAVPGRAVETGNTVVDAALIAAELIQGQREREIAAKLGIDPDSERPRILFTMHRREAFGEPAEQMLTMLGQIAERHPDLDIIYPVHPNPNIHEPAYRLLKHIPNVHLVKPLDYDEIIYALKYSRLLLTDSGGLAEEAPTFGTPSIILRTSTERPEAIDAGAARLAGYDVDLINDLVEQLLKDTPLYRAMSEAKNPYGDGNASLRIVATLAEKAGSNEADQQAA